MTHLDSLAESGLYRPDFEHDNCGFGLIAQMDGRPSHWLVQTAITALGRMTHRGAIGADGRTGDGCGLLLRKPEKFLRAAAAQAGITLGDGEFATGIIFLSDDRIEQIFVSATEEMDTAEFNRHLFVARRRTEIALSDRDPSFYVNSLSAEVILYKGLVMPEYLPAFFIDLEDERLESSIAVFHQRFSNLRALATGQPVRL